MVAESDSLDNLKYMATMIQKKCAKDIEYIQIYGVSEIIKDVYGGVGCEREDSDDSI